MERCVGDIRLISTERSREGFGFFKYAREVGLARPPSPLRQIHSIARFFNCQFLVEDNVPPKDWPQDFAEEAETLRILRGVTKRRFLRVSFFGRKDCGNLKVPFATSRKKAAQSFSRDVDFFQKMSQDISYGLQCIGYVNLCTDYIGKRAVHSYVREAVMRVPGTRGPDDEAGRGNDRTAVPEACPSSKYIHTTPVFSTSVLESGFDIPGSFFAEQQSVVTCCAHAAAMVVLKNVSASLGQPCDVGYGKMNDLLHIDHRTRLAPGGVKPDEIARILAELGGLRVELAATPDVSPEEVIASAYHTVEAGYPAIICFQTPTAGHAMTVVGHTFEPGLWPNARSSAYFKRNRGDYLPSHAWVEGLVVQDDNFGPYCVLPRHTLLSCSPTVIMPRLPWAHRGLCEFPQICAQRVLTHPFLNPLDGPRTLLQDILASSAPESEEANPWFFELLTHVAKRSYVLRTVPCTPKRYLDFLRNNTAIRKHEPDLLTGISHQCRDEPFWLVEISIPELYQWNGRRLGEILIHGDAEAPGEDTATLVRLPGVLTMLHRGGHAEHYEIGGDYHYPLEPRSEIRLDELLG